MYIQRQLSSRAQTKRFSPGGWPRSARQYSVSLVSVGIVTNWDAPRLAGFQTWAPTHIGQWDFDLCCRRPDFHLEHVPLIDSHRSCFSRQITAATAPPPQLCRRDQSAPHRVLVHVVQLLHLLVQTPHVEVIKALLPDMVKTHIQQTGLTGNATKLCQNASREAELHSLHDGRRISLLRFAEEQMNVLRHDHITHHHKLIPATNALQNRQE